VRSLSLLSCDVVVEVETLTLLLSLPLAVYSPPPSAAFFEKVIVEAPVFQILTIVLSFSFPFFSRFKRI
jgi:hypothetical protein